MCTLNITLCIVEMLIKCLIIVLGFLCNVLYDWRARRQMSVLQLTLKLYGIVRFALQCIVSWNQARSVWSLPSLEPQVSSVPWRIGSSGKHGGGDAAQLVRASDRHAADAGSIPRCGKGFFSQSQLSVQTLLRVSVHPRVQSHALTCVRTLKIP